MTNTKTTKRALLSSVMALFLCFAMLLGTTYAWFTDEVTSTGNKIQAGTLKIDLCVMDETGGYISVKESQAPIFDYDLWEPGYISVANVMVENKGTLALQYGMNIVTNGLNDVAEDEAMLSDVIDVYYASEEVLLADRAEFDAAVENGDLNHIGTLTDVIFGGSMIDDTLLANEQDYATIVLKMQETAGNEYQGLAVGTSFDIKIFATQFTYEEDSFDNTYDGNDAVNSIDSLEKLKEAAKMGGEYWLSEDIVITSDVATIIIENDLILHLNGYSIDASAHLSRPFEMADGVSFTINGEVYKGTDATFEGETVLIGNYGLVNIPSGYAATLTLNGGKYIGNTDNGAFIKVRGGSAETEIVLNNVWYNDHGDNENAEKRGFVLSAENHTGTDFTLTVNGGYYKAPVGIATPSATISNATIIATGEPNMNPAIYATKAGNVTLENCTIEAAYHAVAVANKATITVNHCTITADADHYAFQVNKTGGTIYVNNTTYTGMIGTTGKVSYTALIYVDGELKYQKNPA